MAVQAGTHRARRSFRLYVGEYCSKTNAPPRGTMDIDPTLQLFVYTAMVLFFLVGYAGVLLYQWKVSGEGRRVR